MKKKWLIRPLSSFHASFPSANAKLLIFLVFSHFYAFLCVSFVCEFVWIHFSLLLKFSLSLLLCFLPVSVCIQILNKKSSLCGYEERWFFLFHLIRSLASILLQNGLNNQKLHISLYGHKTQPVVCGGKRIFLSPKEAKQ